MRDYGITPHPASSARGEVQLEYVTPWRGTLDITFPLEGRVGERVSLHALDFAFRSIP